MAPRPFQQSPDLRVLQVGVCDGSVRPVEAISTKKMQVGVGGVRLTCKTGLQTSLCTPFIYSPIQEKRESTAVDLSSRLIKLQRAVS